MVMKSACRKSFIIIYDDLELGNILTYYEEPPARSFREEAENVKES